MCGADAVDDFFECPLLLLRRGEDLRPGALERRQEDLVVGEVGAALETRACDAVNRAAAL